MDVSEASFQAAVIDRSHEVPVVVDFWAEWCGPCRQLGPQLERAVAARGDAIELAKVDTDANQRLAQAFGIQSIPAVKAFKGGRVASEFVGSIPPAQIDAFLDALLPSEADRLVAAGDQASLRKALELQPGRADAAVPLARMLLHDGDVDGARAVLADVAGGFAAEGLSARIALVDAAREDPALAGLPAALALLDAGDAASGLDALIAMLPQSGEHRDALRRLIVGVLDELGPESDVARDARRRLAAALY